MYLFGANGHGKIVAEIAEINNISINSFIDDNLEIDRLFNYPIIHTIPSEIIPIVITIGDNFDRKKIVENNANFNCLNLIHPNSFISKRSNIEEGTVIMSGVSINSETKIGKHCIINTNASIDHECEIADFVHISPNAALAGNVIVGEGTHIGIGACVIQGIKIGNWCTIGAGTVILKDIPDGATVVGNPGKIIKIKDVSDL